MVIINICVDICMYILLILIIEVIPVIMLYI